MIQDPYLSCFCKQGASLAEKPSENGSDVDNIRLKDRLDSQNATGHWYSILRGQSKNSNGAKQDSESREYLDLKIISFTKVAPQVIGQVTSSENVPAVIAWDNDLDHFEWLTEILVRHGRE